MMSARTDRGKLSLACHVRGGASAMMDAHASCGGGGSSVDRDSRAVVFRLVA
jgi:hypothetical protein